ncbi:PREDICTED: uncharacterized protein LOC104814943 [Tarenaya hassleriana]|uniref:uncharacterized protein LOC104814943 n=1 Tax=Tarenaya hassleriana TaxID=28532 RepID=UPI00053C8151|nr:PREDICTED: uncharacterized protein LOC104814943 [Tarenaya hassleriana]
MSPFIAIFFVVAFPFTNAVVPNPKTQTLIARICCQTTDFAFCNSSITVSLPSSRAGIATIARLTAANAWIKAIETLDSIRSSLIPKARDPRDREEFVTCEKAYRSVESDLDNAYRFLFLRQYRVVRAYQALALENLHKCKTDFFRTTPMVYANWKVRMLMSMAIYAARILSPPPPPRPTETETP